MFDDHTTDITALPEPALLDGVLQEWQNPAFNFDTTSLNLAQSISVIIPTYNEEPNVELLLQRLHATMLEAGINYEAIVIDDHSADKTVAKTQEVALREKLPVRVYLKKGERGKSFSLLEGFAVARYGLLAMIDGDLQYAPEKLPEMYLKLNEADLVVGNRTTSYTKVSFMRGFMSRFLFFVMRLFFGTHTDVQSGLKLFRREILETVTLKPHKWNFDMLLVVQSTMAGYRIADVPIGYDKRHGGASKVVPWLVGVELLSTVVKIRLEFTFNKIVQIMGGKPTPVKTATRLYDHKPALELAIPNSLNNGFITAAADSSLPDSSSTGKTEGLTTGELNALPLLTLTNMELSEDGLGQTSLD